MVSLLTPMVKECCRSFIRKIYISSSNLITSYDQLTSDTHRKLISKFIKYIKGCISYRISYSYNRRIFNHVSRTSHSTFCRAINIKYHAIISKSPQVIIELCRKCFCTYIKECKPLYSLSRNCYSKKTGKICWSTGYSSHIIFYNKPCEKIRIMNLFISSYYNCISIA